MIGQALAGMLFVSAAFVFTFGAQMVIDLRPNLSPGVAIASGSGFDYVNAPEPGAGLMAPVAAACLAVLRPRRRSAARVA